MVDLKISGYAAVLAAPPIAREQLAGESATRIEISHRLMAYHLPESNSYIERFHRSSKEEEVRMAEYRTSEEVRGSMARWIEGYNRDRSCAGVENPTSHEAFLAFTAKLNSETLSI